MRRLFLKIFLWFWIANIIALGALALTMWLAPNALFPPPGRFENLTELQLRGALAILESRGEEAFASHLARLEVESGIHVFLFDADGRELLNRPASEEIRRRLTDRHSGAAPSPGPQRPPFFGPMDFELAVSDGRQIRAIVEPGGPGVGPPFLAQLSLEVIAARMLVVISLTGLACYALARYVTSPLRDLEHTARQVGAGDLAVRVSERLTARRDEIGELGREFDRMTEQVQSLLSVQKRLLRDVSHELRSPLARLNVALELARRETPEPAHAALDRIGYESDRLNELIGMLLSLARLEGGVPDSAAETVDLASLLRRIATDGAFEGATRGVNVRVMESRTCHVAGVPLLLRSAIENVVRNAVRFTADGTTVEVRLRRTASDGDGRALVEVRDYGPGIEEASLDEVFKPFYRVAAARDRESGGAGLGLAITDRVVRSHGGKAMARNEPSGGLTVSLEFPLAGPGSGAADPR